MLAFFSTIILLVIVCILDTLGEPNLVFHHHVTFLAFSAVNSDNVLI